MRLTGGNALINAQLLLERSGIGEGMKVADLGCGISGHFVFPAARLVGKKGKIYAVDILRNVLETIVKIARQDRLENVETVWSDLETFGATKIDPASLDIAFLINTLYQTKRKIDVIKEAARLVKKNGKIVVAEWKNIAIPFGPSPENRVNEPLLKDWLAKIGFTVEDEFEAGPYHYGIVFVK